MVKSLFHLILVTWLFKNTDVQVWCAIYMVQEYVCIYGCLRLYNYVYDRPATTPRMVRGSISMWVCSGVISSSQSATRQLFSSFTSTYSITPVIVQSFIHSSLSRILFDYDFCFLPAAMRSCRRVSFPRVLIWYSVSFTLP